MTEPTSYCVHKYGLITLQDSMSGDLGIVNAARCSFDQRSEEIGESEVGLINFLMRNRHGTPFEMVELKFEVKAPIFVFREWHRHRIASVNEWSGRYSKLEREFYIPSADYFRTQVGKPGAYTFEQIQDAGLIEWAQLALLMQCESAYALYEALLAKGIAKEQARIHLPVNLYSKMVWKTNLRALFNFLSLRNSEHAMREIRDYAEIMEGFARMVAPVAMEAFVANGRVSP